MATTDKGPDNQQYLTRRTLIMKLPHRLTVHKKCATILNTKKYGTVEIPTVSYKKQGETNDKQYNQPKKTIL